MASDSEGLRLDPPFSLDTSLRVENGFRFGRVTTKRLSLTLISPLLKMASDSEGLRLKFGSRGQSIVPLKMASDSEGLRLNLFSKHLFGAYC